MVCVCVHVSGYEHQVKAAQDDILKIVRELVSTHISINVLIIYYFYYYYFYD